MISTVFACGVMPAGQERSRTITVAGFTLPVAMVYSTAPNVQARFPGIAPSEAAARGFVERLVVQTVLGVLEHQARSALLPDAVISAILSQLNVKVNYKPMNCQMSVRPEDKLIKEDEEKDHCIIVGNTTTNVIMASWSRMMWQDVINRAVRMLALGPFESHFYSASGTVGGG
ncbi:hypothetical protein KIN20_022435 [Parelaphostrongylus tenuis]|uniref:Uncharacterized protein n=1 Tax=Parelaphostrongylus tenuis TaxID=148309 RepID=A0AAD5MVI2_PARTN|nr:hypothetical protein KIN20_022435 [Parelaphostrongylus tenuis]